MQQFLNKQNHCRVVPMEMFAVLQYYLNLKMSHYNYTNAASMTVKQANADVGSFEKAVITNAKESIEKHLSHLKIDQNQLNYALFLSIEHFRLEEHTDECMLMLLRHKANPNCEYNKQTPLTSACRKGQQQLVKLLLEYGAKPDLCNKNGEHPLLVVLNSKRENFDVASCLLNYMASANIELGGKMAILIALEKQFFRIFQMLIEKGANLVFEAENILHMIAKKKFRKLDKKKQFVKELAGRSYLMQEDSGHKLPTQYEENQDIKQFMIDNFKPKVVKQDSLKQSNRKQKQIKDNKQKDSDNTKENKKKSLNNKQLDGSFSQFDDEEFHEDRCDVTADNKKLKKVIEMPDEEETIDLTIKKQKQIENMNANPKTQKLTQSNSLKDIQLTKELKSQKSVTQNQNDLSISEKQRQQQRQKIKKKLNSSMGLTESKRKSVNIDIGSKKKKTKVVEEIVPKTLLKRKNSSIEEQLSKGDKNKAVTIKKTTITKKQVQSPQKIDKQRVTLDDQKFAQEKRIAIFKQFADLGLHIEPEKTQNQTDSQSSLEDYYVNLSEQIYDQANKINFKNQQKLPIIEQTLKLLEETIRKQLQKIKQGARLDLYVYGSQSTGLAIENSDIDVLLVTDFEVGYLMKKFQQQGTLKTEDILDCKFITGASMPVIKLKMSEKYDWIQLDLTFQNKNHMGLKCSEMIKGFMEAEPLLRPLVLVIKTLVQAYDISDPYKGGISSYAITLMIIALLQFTERDKKKMENIGEIFLNFLYFYGQEMDYVSQAIIIHDLGLFGDQPVYSIYRLPYLTDLNPKLIIYDPLNPVNNVGRTTYRIAALKNLFTLCYLRLKQDRSCRLADIMDGSFGQLLTDF